MYIHAYYVVRVQYFLSEIKDERIFFTHAPTHTHTHTLAYSGDKGSIYLITIILTADIIEYIQSLKALYHQITIITAQ